MTNKYIETLNSERWRKLKWRRIILAGFACEKCGMAFGDKRPREAMKIFDLHHVSYANVGCESIEDVRALCRECHFSRDMHPWRCAR